MIFYINVAYVTQDNKSPQSNNILQQYLNTNVQDQLFFRTIFLGLHVHVYVLISILLCLFSTCSKDHIQYSEHHCDTAYTKVQF